MKRARFLTACLVFGALACGGLAAWAEAQPAPTALVPGVFDPKTKTFTAIPRWWHAPSSGASTKTTTATTVVRGTLKVTVALTLSPAVPAGNITAEVLASAFDTTNPTTGTTYRSQSTYFITLTRGSSTASGSITFPFVATVNSSTYQMQVQATDIGASAGAQLNLVQMIPVPANGSTTTVAFRGDL